MYISKIRIKNFKCIKDITIKLEPHFNLIIGKNNSGKSTIFEAMRLWQLAFYKFVKDERTNNQESSFRSTHYFSFTINDLSFLRINSFKRLFHNNTTKNILIQITVEEKGISIDLPIEFTLTTEELNLRFSLFMDKSKDSDSKVVAEKRKQASEIITRKMLGKPQGSSLKNLMLITYISPIFQLPTNEPYFAKGYIREMLHQSQVANVLRNLIHPYAPKDYQTKAKQLEYKSKEVHLTNIEKQLDRILFGIDRPIPELSFTSGFKENDDAVIDIFANNSITNSKVELSQLGSGTINLLNILSVLAFGDSEGINLNILLLDEPDSHLHSNHQVQLFKYLKSISSADNKQMFIITHNHELISCADRVIYITGGKQEIQAIQQEQYCKILEELADNSDYYQIMVERNKYLRQILEITRPTLYCEGSSDVHILKVAYQKLYNKELSNLDIVDGNSASGVAEILKAARKDIFVFGLFDSDKAGIEQFYGFKKNGIVKTKINENMQRLDFKKDNNSPIEETRRFVMKLPIPSFRHQSAKWFDDNTCIEYMFPNEILKVAGVEMEIELGTNYQKIVNLEGAKKKIQESVANFDKKYFEPFRPIFEAINQYVKIIL